MAIDSKNLLVWVKAMSRGQALPLDASEVYESMTDAETYASSAIAYAGQTIKVKMDDGKYHEYILQPSASGYVLEEVIGSGDGSGNIGSTVIVDDSLSISGAAADAKVVGDAISKLNIDVATKINTPEFVEVGQILSVKSIDEDGNITWETVNPGVTSGETTPEDIIEWMSEENIIIPLASSSGEVYLTNDNKIIII